MCVLTYLPNNTGYVVTSNRDEATARAAAIPPQKYEVNGKQLYFPKDPQGEGTWLATDGSTTVCLLNGGYKNHVRKLPYRQSRGLVVTDFFDFKSVEEFYNNYLFTGIEPFTLVIFSQDKDDIKEIRWTGEQADLHSFDSSVSRIWSSATLYSDKIISERQIWFSEFLKAEDMSAEKILHFHHFGGKGDEQNDIRMNRAGVLKTVAITQFEVKENSFVINYEDLQAKKFTELSYEKQIILST
jgi:uncharacterized protein with NRDE domain